MSTNDAVPIGSANGGSGIALGIKFGTDSVVGWDTILGFVSTSVNGFDSNILSLTCKFNEPRIFPFAVTSIS